MPACVCFPFLFNLIFGLLTLSAIFSLTAVVVGADRVVANGDTANKVGTYQLAIAAKHHGIPFYVAAPSTSCDLSLESGRDIIIEVRPPEELTSINGVPIAAPGEIYVSCLGCLYEAERHKCCKMTGMGASDFRRGVRTIRLREMDECGRVPVTVLSHKY